MFCPNCKVNVDSAYDLCPLCKAPLEGDASEYPFFPERKVRKKRRPVTAKGICFYMMFPIIFISTVLNIVLPHKYIWALFVAIVALYVYYSLKTTIFYKGPGGAKVFSQFFMLTVLCISAQYIFKTNEWAFSYAIPILSIVALLLHLAGFIAFHKSKGRQFFRYMWLSAILGTLPAIMIATGVCNIHYLAMTAFIISTMIIIILFIVSGKKIFEEIKKKSHI